MTGYVPDGQADGGGVPDSLSEIVRAWEEGDRTERNRLRAGLLHGPWEEACRRAVRESDTGEVSRWIHREGIRADILEAVSGLGPGEEFYARQMTAYLHCAGAALADSPGEAERLLQEASGQTDLPIGFYRDLKALLLGQPLPSPVVSQRMGALLVEIGGRGVVTTLLLERLQRGTGALYPSPAQGFLFRDPRFQEAERNARAYARSGDRPWADDSDVRWSLEDLPHRQAWLRDPSLGGGLAAALASLFTDPSDLSRYAITGGVDPEGRLIPVEHLRVKLGAARTSRGRITDVVIPGESKTPERPEGAVSVWPEPSVARALGTLRRLRRRERRLRAAKRYLTVGLMAAALAFAGISVERATYHFKVQGGERVVVNYGLPGLGYREIDTGLVQSDFVSDKLTDLSRGVRWRVRSGRYGWASDALGAMPLTATRARLLMRLGSDMEEYIPELYWQIRSVDTGDRLAAAEAIAALGDSEVRRKAVPVLLADLQHNDGLVRARAAAILLDLDRRQAGRVRAAMRALIKKDGNNFVNIPAVEALLKADPAAAPFAIRFLRPLLRDPNNLIKAEAVESLFRIDRRYAGEALRLLPPLLADENGAVREGAFHALKTVATSDPERVAEAASKSPYTHHFISEGTRRAIEGMARAQDDRSFERAAWGVRDVFFFSQVYASEASRLITQKVAKFALDSAKGGGTTSPVDYLLRKMQTPLADKWSVYRTGCGNAIPLVVPSDRRPQVRRRLWSLWKSEDRPEIRIALGEALEQQRWKDPQS